MLMKDGTPSANMFAAGEIMAGNVLGQRLCGRHGHDHRQRVRPHRRNGGGAQCSQLEGGAQPASRDGCSRSRPADDGLQLLPLLRGAVRRVSRDGDAPRISRRRSELSRQPLPRLRRLLRRLPVLAAARVRRERAARAGAGPQRVPTRLTPGRAFSRRLFERNGLVISLVAAIAVAAFIFGFVGLARPIRTVRHAYRARRVLQADAACRDGMAVRARVPLRDRRDGARPACLLARHRRSAGARLRLALAGDHATPARCAISMAAASAATTTTNGRTTGGSLYHHLTFYGFALCFASTCVATVYHYACRPYSAVSLVGPAGGARHGRRHRADLRSARTDDRKAQARSDHGRRARGSAWTSRFWRCCF